MPRSEVWQRFADDCLAAGVATMASAAAGEQAEPTIEPARGDRRFRDPAWQENPVYSGMLQGYLLWSRMMRELVDVAELDRSTDRKARFAVDAMIDALAPTNTLLGNPAALRRAFETGGRSVQRGDGAVPRRPRQQRRPAVARSTCRSSRSARISPPSPGSVVFRNELIELIQYAPVTKTVHAVPLLLSPPWINKYYVMDLAPGKSFVEWAVAHGHTVFAISYVNPGSRATRLRLRRLPRERAAGGARRRAGDHRRGEGERGGALPRRHARGVRGRLAGGRRRRPASAR